MTRYWARARAGSARRGSAARDVTFVDRRRPVHRGRRPGASPPADATRLPGADAARLRQRPLARLPPGAARADPRPAAARSGPGGTRMYAVAARLDPGLLPRAGPRRLRRDGAGRRHRVGEFHYLHHGPGGAPATPTRTRWATAAGAGGGRRRPPDHPARHLLPRRGRGSAAPLQGAAAPVRRRRREAWADRASPAPAPGRRRWIGAAVHSVRAVPRGRARRPSRRVGRGPPAARAPVRAARRERGLPGGATAGPRPAARRRRACSGRRRPRCTPPT